MVHNKERALEPIEFTQMLRVTGDFYGQPFVLFDWQHDVLWNVYGYINDFGYRQYKYVYLEIAKKNGKALAIDTPIPTPSGWTTMGELQVGDAVFDEKGKPCKVTFSTDIMCGHKCFEVYFSDGSHMVADSEHNWLTNAWIDRPGRGKNNTKINKKERRYSGSITRVRTTEEIYNSLKIQNTTNNHSISVCGALDLPYMDVSIPPYALGAWLGDGNASGARIVCCDEDIEIIDNIRNEGVPIAKYKAEKRTPDYGLTTGIRSSVERQASIQTRLRKLNLLNNKHIPPKYLRASICQRIELLQGLMDTDGYVSKAGQCEFTTIKPKLRDDVVELLHSLGYKATIKTSTSRCNGKDCGLKYRIQFWAYRDNPCFKLKRKLNRLKANTKKTRSTVRHIIDVVKIESVPVKCIKVDSPRHLYLAGNSMIPTHNTELAAKLALYHLTCDPPDGQIYCCAADRGQAELVYKAAIATMGQCEYLKFLKLTDSRKEILNTETKTRLKVLSAEAYSKHGLNPTVVIFDELHAQPNRSLWDVMTFGAGAARKEPLWWVITTAGNDPDRNSIGWEIHEYARKIKDEEILDPTWYVKIFNAPDDADIFDEETWKLANPSIGKTVSVESVRQEALYARNSESAERLFRWLRLNQWVSLKKTSWLPLTLWDETLGKWNPAELVGKKCYAGLDLSSTIDLTGLALLFPPQADIPGWRVLFEAWIPEDKMKERIARDQVPYDKWVKNKHLHATPGDAVDYDFVEARIIALSKQYKIQALCPDQWNSRMLTQRLDKQGIQIVEISQNMAGMSPAMKEIERLLRIGQLTHEPHPVARWCFGNVNIAIDGNENMKPMKNKSKDRIDIMIALINAMAYATRVEKINVYEIRGMRSLA